MCPRCAPLPTLPSPACLVRSLPPPRAVLPPRPCGPRKEAAPRPHLYWRAHPGPSHPPSPSWPVPLRAGNGGRLRGRVTAALLSGHCDQTLSWGAAPPPPSRSSPGAAAPSPRPLYLLVTESRLRPFKAWKSARLKDALPFQSRPRWQRLPQGTMGGSSGGTGKAWG